MSRTYRKPYTKSRRFDPSCRAHGGCDYCESNRTIAIQRAQASAASQEQDNEQEQE